MLFVLIGKDIDKNMKMPPEVKYRLLVAFHTLCSIKGRAVKRRTVFFAGRDAED